MSFLAGLFLGILGTLIFYLTKMKQEIIEHSEKVEIVKPVIKFKTQGKRRPKAIDDSEIARRENMQPPKDPGIS